MQVTTLVYDYDSECANRSYFQGFEELSLGPNIPSDKPQVIHFHRFEVTKLTSSHIPSIHVYPVFHIEAKVQPKSSKTETGTVLVAT